MGLKKKEPCFKVLSHEPVICEHCGSTLLTGRLTDIISLVCAGHSQKEIGYRLNLTVGTVKIYMQYVYNRLAQLHVETEEGNAIRTMPALAVWWLRN